MNVSNGAVRAFGSRKDNAQLMADCHRLGYVGDDDLVADVTFGLGRFWKKYCPPMLLASDLDAEKSPSGESVDFRDLPYVDGELDVVVFDPPYKFSGTSRVTSDDGYGIGVYMSVQDRLDLIRGGVIEAARVVKPGGRVLVKCQDQVVSGRVVWQTMKVTEAAAVSGLRLVDMLHVSAYRPQPSGVRQLHARRDYSTLLVFEKVGSK